MKSLKRQNDLWACKPWYYLVDYIDAAEGRIYPLRVWSKFVCHHCKRRDLKVEADSTHPNISWEIFNTHVSASL